MLSTVLTNLAMYITILIEYFCCEFVCLYIMWGDLQVVQGKFACNLWRLFLVFRLLPMEYSSLNVHTCMCVHACAEEMMYVGLVKKPIKTV